MTDAAEKQHTWNSPEQIARHRAMSPADRIRLCVELSRAAMHFAGARPIRR